jgi:hypothetical protein
VSTTSEGRHALVVATARYSDPKLAQLRAPAADAARLAAVLSDPAKGDFEVEVLVDEVQATLSRRIARFFADRRPDDLLLLHFSCHGVKDDRGELFLAATDTEIDLLSATAVSAAWLNDQISRTRSRRTVVLLDCCFSGSFPFGMRARGSSVDAPQQFEGRGRALITASSAMEYAYEGDELRGEGQPSIFTEAVVEGLETGEADLDGDQRVSIDDLYNYVYDRVKQRTPSQTPKKMSELEGPLYLAKSSYRRKVEPAALDPELIARTEDRYAGIRQGAVQELAALVGGSDPAIALAAREALARMVDDDSRSVSAAAQAALAEPDPEPVAPAPPPRPPPAPIRSSTRGGPHRGLIAALAALPVVIAAVLVLVLSGDGGGDASSELSSTMLAAIPASISAGNCIDTAKPCCKQEVDDPWIVKNWHAEEQANCDNSRFGDSLTYARFANPQKAQEWVRKEQTQGDPCDGATKTRMGQLHAPAAELGCLTIPDGDDKGVHLFWVDRGSTVAGYYSPGTLDQHAAVTAWQGVVNAP